jgi:hypothetical protein
LHKAEKASKKSALSCSVGAHEAEAGTCFEMEVKTLKDRMATEGLVKGLCF